MGTSQESYGPPTRRVKHMKVCPLYCLNRTTRDYASEGTSRPRRHPFREANHEAVSELLGADGNHRRAMSALRRQRRGRPSSGTASGLYLLAVVSSGAGLRGVAGSLSGNLVTS